MFQPKVVSKIGEDISILVKLDNHPWNYLCECGDASDLTVKEVQNAIAVFISHTHLDHFANFDAVLRHQIGTGRRVVICGPANIAQQVHSRVMSYNWNLIEKGEISYEIRVLVEEDKMLIYEIEPPIWELKFIGEQHTNIIFEHADFQVSAILLDHKTPTLAYKFKEKDTVKIDIQASGFKGGRWVKDLKTAFANRVDDATISIEGKDYSAKSLFHLLRIQLGDSVGIIMDHAPSEANHNKIIQHFMDCRTVFIESFYKAADKAYAELNYHSYSTKSAQVMRAANVKEPIPVHFSRKYDAEEVASLIKEFEAALNE